MLRTSIPRFAACSAAIGLFAACSGGGGGGAPGGPDTPAAAESLVVLDTKVVPARLRIVVRDAESDPTAVQFAYELHTARGVFVPLVGLPQNPVTLTSSPGGVVHELPWNWPAESGLPDDGRFFAGITVVARIGAETIETVVAGIGNDAPLLQVGAIGGEVRGTVAVPFVARDSSADPVAIKVEYRIEGDAAGWQLARPQGLLPGDPTPEFAFPSVSAPARGAAFQFWWDSASDLVDLERDVRLRFTPRDPVATGLPAETAPFRVDNDAEPTVAIDEAVWAGGADRRNGLPLPLRVVDDEGDPVRVLLQWRFASEPDFPLLDTSDQAALLANLRDPAFRRLHHVCSPFASPIVGRIVPVDATRVRLPQLTLDAHSARLADGVAGREIEILRTSPSFAPLATHWPNNPLRAPVAAVPCDGGARAFVLEEVLSGAELIELDLATGAVVRTIALMPGTPTALVPARTPGRLLAATDQGGDWRLFEVDPFAGAATLRAQRAVGDVAGPLRGLAASGTNSALATAGDRVMRIDWLGAPKTVTVRSGLAEPWGVALDPHHPGRAFVVERGAARILVLDLATRTAAPLGGFTAAGLQPSALAISPDGARLGVLLRAPSPFGTSFVGAIELGAPAQQNLPVPGDNTGICFGPDRLLLVAQKGSRNLTARFGIEQRRRIVAFAPATATATVDAPFAPAPGARRVFRFKSFDPATDTIAASPAGSEQRFVWDTADVPSGEPVVLRALPLDVEAGPAHAMATPFVRAGDAPAMAVQLPVVGPRALLAADIDGDGDLDLVATSPSTDSLALFEQRGPGSFAPAIVLGGAGVSPAPSDVEAADVDGDGDLDLAVAGSGGLLVFAQTAPWSFTSPVRIDPPGFPAPRRIVAVDLDADGDVDFASANGSVAAALFQVAPAAFAPPVSLGLAAAVPGALATDVAAGDVDGDGAIDVSIAFSDSVSDGPANGVAVFAPTGVQSFGAPLIVPSPRPVATLRATDADGDGGVDLVVAEGGQAPRVGLLRHGSLARTDVVLSGAGSSFVDVAVSDLDGDGNADFVCADGPTNVLEVARQTAPRVFALPALTLGGPGVTDGPRALVAADFDSDGCVDVACASETGGAIVVLLRGVGRHFAEIPVGVGSAQATPQPQEVTLGDLDADGRLDLAITGAAGTSSLFVQQDSGELVGPTAVIASSTPQAVAAAAGDLDGDGDTDLAVSNGTLADIRIARQIAPGQFVDEPLVAGGLPWNTTTSIAIGDLDGDGDNDIAALEAAAIAIAFQQTPGVFTPVPLRLPATPSANVPPLLVDLDGDGDLDLAIAEGTGVTTWRQTAAGTFGPPVPLAVPGVATPVRALAAADFDGDGAVDLAAANDLDLVVFRAVAPGSFAFAASVPSVGNQALAALDHDGDGDQDLVCVRSGQLFLLPLAAPLVFAPPQLLGGTGLSRLRVGDVDGDGDPDVVALDGPGQRAQLFFGGR